MMIPKLLIISILFISAVKAEITYYTPQMYGAVGDGVSDDTEEIQASVNAAIGDSKILIIPIGDYKITGTIVVADVWGFNMIGMSSSYVQGGKLSRFIWYGNSSSPAILVSDVRESHFERFQILAKSGYPLMSGIKSVNGSSSTVTPTGNSYERIYIQGGVAGNLTYGFDFSGEIDANNDHGLFVKCDVRNYSEAGYYMQNTQLKGFMFIDCSFSGSGSGKYGFKGDASFSWQGGGGGDNEESDFYLTGVNDVVTIEKGNFEKSKRFLITSGPTSAVGSVTLSGNSWNGVDLISDGAFIDFRRPGPLTVTGNNFEGMTVKESKIRINNANTLGAFVCYGNWISSSLDWPFEFTSAANTVKFIFSNTHVGNSSFYPNLLAEKFIVFQDQDTTPSVAGGHKFKFSNTCPTTVTSFDNGNEGQKITTLFTDSMTTIDFTSSGIKGHGGTDWTPSAGESMSCVYDGTYWYCN